MKIREIEIDRLPFELRFDYSPTLLRLVDDDDNLDNLDWVQWAVGSNALMMDGFYTVRQLRALADWLEGKSK